MLYTVEEAEARANAIIAKFKDEARAAGAVVAICTVQFDCDETWDGSTGGLATTDDTLALGFQCLDEARAAIPIEPLPSRGATAVSSIVRNGEYISIHDATDVELRAEATRLTQGFPTRAFAGEREDMIKELLKRWKSDPEADEAS